MSLRNRLTKHETMGKFEIARRDRLVDSSVLASNGRHHGAIYFLGYFVEMTLKSAIFWALGYPPDMPIRFKDLDAFASLIRETGLLDSHESFHNSFFWARALIQLQESLGRPLDAKTAQELTVRSQRFSGTWNVSMRYRRNCATSEEWLTSMEDALWIKDCYQRMAS